MIALMAAQAFGRATLHRDGAALAVALGAGCFMVSDALLAMNRFVSPLPMPQVWVLTTYYLAQVLIVMGVLRGRSAERQRPLSLKTRPRALRRLRQEKGLKLAARTDDAHCPTTDTPAATTKTP